MSSSLGKLYRTAVPRAIQPFLDCKRASRYWKEVGVIFVHVPKSAGTSISTALYGRTLGHIMARDIVRYSPSIFNSCFKFAFVREPLERYVSAFSYIKKNFEEIKGGPGLPSNASEIIDPESFFDEYVLNAKNPNYVFHRQVDYLFHDGKLLVDHLGRYEEFNSEMFFLSKKMPRLKNLPILNSSEEGKRHVHFSAFLEAKIRDYYREDYENLGYGENA